MEIKIELPQKAIDMLEMKLQQSLDTVNKNLKKGMDIAGDTLCQEAAKRTPILTGQLTASFNKKIEGSGLQWTAIVYIPTNSPASDYALYMHEGHYKLGEVSKQKQLSNPDVVVGRKYLERAFSENKDLIVKIIRNQVAEALK
jgi:hypothetical protein